VEIWQKELVRVEVEVGERCLGTIGKIVVPIVESDQSPSPVTEGSLQPEVFDDAIDSEGSELENWVDKLDMEIDQ
jgi:hypothetical protein